MAEDIRSLSAALARDPSSLVYLELAEALRRTGKLNEAIQVATHGLGRHPEHADGYDCLARIHSDRGELLEARLAWERALAIVPEHAGALKGVGFLFFRQGDTKRAIDTLQHALDANPDDESARRAVEMMRGAAPSSPRKTEAEVPQLRATASAILTAQIKAAELDSSAAAARDAALRAARVSGTAATPSVPSSPRPPVFAGLEGATADILLLDGRGLVMAGGLTTLGGEDVSELAAAALAGVSGEAQRTSGYLNLATWTSIVAEAEHANVVLTPVGENALLMLRREKSTPVGLAVRIAERARQAAARWLEDNTA